MEINDKVTIIDYDECELYYFNEDINRRELELHCCISKKSWNECQRTNFLIINSDSSFQGIDSFALRLYDEFPSYNF